MNKIISQYVFASAFLLATSTVSLFWINTAHAQAPSLNLERLDDYSLRLNWENIRTDNAMFNILIDESGAISILVQVDIATTGRAYTFRSRSFIPSLLEVFDRVNVADRLGVSGNAGTDDRVDVQWVNVPSPSLNVERLFDNSIQLTWSNIHTIGALYAIPIIESGARNLVNLSTTAETLNIPTDHTNFARINAADQICVLGSDAEGLTLPGDALCKSVPNELPDPSLTVERLIGNSIRLTWDGIRTSPLIKSYQIFVKTGTTETRIDFALFFDIKTAVIDPDYFAFNQINSADRVGVAGRLNTGSGFADVDKTFQPVPAQKLPSVDFARQDNGDIIISWENIRDTNGRNSIWVTEDGTDTSIAPNVISGSPYSVPTGSTHYDRISNAQRVGVSDFGANVDAVTFANILSADADLASLTISEDALTPTFAADTLGYTVSVDNDVASVTLTPTTADDDASVTVAGTMVTSGAAPAPITLAVGETAIAIIVTAEDTSVTKTYTITVTRAIGISNLDGESGVSINDAKFLYYAHALGPALNDSNQATVLGPLTSAGDGELGGLLTAAKGLLIDLNGDGESNAEDAAVLYYSFALEASLGNGTDTKPGIEEIKEAILGPLAGTNDMNAINTMLQEAHRARGL